MGPPLREPGAGEHGLHEDPHGATSSSRRHRVINSTFQSLNLVASVSNVKIMEGDPDAVPIRDELFTALPEITDRPREAGLDSQPRSRTGFTSSARRSMVSMMAG